MPKKTTYEFVIDGEVKTFETGVEEAPTKGCPATPKAKKQDEPRDRKFCCTTYIQDFNALVQFLKRSEWVQHWAVCIHDKDFEEDGVTPKQTHCHILLYTYNAKTVSSVRKLFDRLAKSLDEENPQNTLAQICYDMAQQWRYLIHADDKGKYQYDTADRLCDNFAYWHKLEKSAGMNDSSDNYGLSMLTDYMNGVHPLEMAHRYGKEYIYHLTHYQKFAFEIAKHDMRQNATNLNLRDMMALCLEGSPLKDETINAFWVCYDYIISQINNNYNSKIEFYLTEKEN